MPGIQITPEELSSAAITMDQKSASIDTEIAALKALVGNIAAFWTGRAHDSFESVYQEWDSSFRNMNDALKRISQNAKTAAENYSSTEAANTFR